MRRQFREQRFALVLGAGVSVPFGVPQWEKYVNSIAADDRVDGLAQICDTSLSRKASLPYKSQLLFQRFRDKWAAARGCSDLSAADENQVVAEWMKTCASHLYPADCADIEGALKRHIYFESLLRLVKRTHLTVNFNFDDYLVRSLHVRKDADDRERGYEIVTNPWPQTKRKDSVIFHPHGMVPAPSTPLMEVPVDRFVFSEAGYAKQYVGGGAEETSFLLAHFARNTCLLLGCSLEDVLRSVLIKGASMNPGNYHYYVQYLKPGEEAPSAEERKAISDANFKTFNVITLFLDDEQINALLDMVNDKVVSRSQFKNLALQAEVPWHFKFYMTGPLGVGKSTSVGNFRNLSVLDEWMEPRPEILGKPWQDLSDEERIRADEWIARQFSLKNENMQQQSDDEAGITLVDRPPLDPLAFSPKKDRPKRAGELLNAICPGRKWKVQDGAVILLLGEPYDLSVRVKATDRPDYTEDKLRQMQVDLKELYDFQNVRPIDTRGMSAAEVAQRVAEVIHREPYQEAPLHDQLEKIEKSS
jgi:hypothetical protein